MSRRGVLTGLAGAAALISVVTVVSRLLGFGRSLVYTSAVGLTEVGGAYNLANTVPNVLFEVAAGGALAGALIPVIAGPLARGMREDVSRIASAMLGWTLLMLTVLAGALAAVAGPIATALGASASGPEHDLTVFFLRVFAVQVPLYGLAVVLAGVLQAQRRFFWPAFAPVLSSVVVIGTYAWFGVLVDRAGVDRAHLVPGQLPAGSGALLAWGTTAGVAAMGLPLLIPVLRSGVRLLPSLRFPPGVAARAGGLALAGVGGLVAQQIAVLVTVRLSRAYGTPGTLVGYQNIVQAVYMLPYAVLAVPLATSTFPRLAERAAHQDRAGYASLAAVTTRVVLVASGVGAAVLAAVAPAVVTVFARVSSGGADVIPAVADALTLMAPGLLGLGLIFHVSRALYALERGRLAVLATSLGWATVVVASWVACLVLVPSGGDGPATLRALSTGNAIGMTVAGVALLAVLRRAAGRDAVAGVGRTVLVLVVAAAVAGVAGRWTVDAVQTLTDGVVGAVAAAAGGGAVALAIVMALLWWADRTTLTGLVRRGRARGTGTGGGAPGAGRRPASQRDVVAAVEAAREAERESAREAAHETTRKDDEGSPA